MKYDVCIIGHGNFPSGLKSAVKLIAGTCDRITCFNLNEETTHEQFEQDVEQYIQSHTNVIFFADMVGGAPYQIVAKKVLLQNDVHKFIVAGVSLNLVLDIYLKNMSEQLNTQNIDNEIKHVINESKSLMKEISCKQDLEKES
ncbi:MAG: PTS fructose transporter subunit IIA [Lactobacillus helsingborgensis]|nr:PTS fructose transporter subunit IIA [Lactobacillus helsingborgensis]